MADVSAYTASFLAEPGTRFGWEGVADFERNPLTGADSPTVTLDPLFTEDENGDPFVTGITYKLLSQNDNVNGGAVVFHSFRFDSSGVLVDETVPQTPPPNGSAGSLPQLVLSTDDNGKRSTLNLLLLAAAAQGGDATAINLLIDLLVAADNATLEQLGIRLQTIGYAGGAGATKLSQLTEYIASQSIKLQDGGNFITQQKPGDALSRRGLIHQLLDALGQATTQAGFTIESNGATGFFQGPDELRLLNGILSTTADALDAHSTGAVFQSLALSELGVTTRAATGLLTAEINQETGQYELKQVSAEGIFSLLLVPFSQYVASLGLTPASQPRQVVALKCVTVPVDPQTVQYITVASADYGDPKDHNLQTTGANIWVEVQANGSPAADLVTITFTGNSELTLTPNDTDITDTTFIVKLTNTTPTV